MSPDSPILIALGGNALILAGERGYIEEQFDHARACMVPVARLISGGTRVVITHGNGPIVGNILLRNECAREAIPPMPLYICVADSQGGIGAMMAEALANELRLLRAERTVPVIITHVCVAAGDPAFQDPTKPIGPYYTDDRAREHQGRSGWHMRNIPGRGWRRLVPSPRPVRIVELEAVRSALRAGMVPIAAGGGGIPVVEENGLLRGVDAVIDKDLTAGLLGRELGLERFAILTDVDGVCLDWGTERRRLLRTLGVREARRHLNEGQFPPGDMGPKIEAAIGFLDGGGREVFVGRPEDLQAMLSGEAGTRIHH